VTFAPTSSVPTGEFVAATRALFDAFAPEPFDPGMPRCAHCVSDDDVARLGEPVVTLDPAHLARFVTKAGTTWGRPQDLRRVAPRALVLAADRKLPIDRGLLWSKLGWAGWPDWTRVQTAAVHRFLMAEWTRLLHTPPGAAEPAHRWLRVHGSAVGDLGPFLDRWHEAIGPVTTSDGRRAATLHLVELLVHSELRPDFPVTVARLIPDDPTAAGRLAGWLTCTGTAHELARAGELLVDTVDARRVQLAGERIRRFHAAVERADVHAG
jgi:hypothetical protein